MQTPSEVETLTPRRHLRAVSVAAAERRDTLISQSEVAARNGISSSTVDRRVAAGLMTPPILLSARCRRWPNGEDTDVRRAVTAGATDDELRALVLSLVAARGVAS